VITGTSNCFAMAAIRRFGSRWNSSCLDGDRLVIEPVRKRGLGTLPTGRPHWARSGYLLPHHWPSDRKPACLAAAIDELTIVFIPMLASPAIRGQLDICGQRKLVPARMEIRWQ
jgi:hypothetical protein